MDDYEIEFRPDDGPTQTLYASLSRRDADKIQRDIDSPNATDIVLYIPSRVKKNGPTKEWMFRASRITLRKVQ